MFPSKPSMSKRRPIMSSLTLLMNPPYRAQNLPKSQVLRDPVRPDANHAERYDVDADVEEARGIGYFSISSSILGTNSGMRKGFETTSS